MDGSTVGIMQCNQHFAFVFSNDDTFVVSLFYWENILQLSISEAINRVLLSPQVFLVSLNALSMHSLAFEIKMMAYISMWHSLSGDRK